MATFKPVILADSIRKDGTVRLKIKVLHNRERRYIDTALTLEESDYKKVVKKTSEGKAIAYQIRTQSFIDSADDLCRKFRKKCNELYDRIDGLTVDEVKDLIQGKEMNDIDFIQFGRDRVSELLDSGHKGNASVYTTALNALERYNQNKPLPINSISYDLLCQFRDWIIANPAGPKKNTTQSRAPSLYLGAIRSLHNDAKEKYNDEDRGIIRIPYSPFNKFKLPKSEPTQKRAITADQVRAIMALPDEELKNSSGSNRFNLAKDCFILSFCLIGINSADLFSCGPIVDGVLRYSRQKTANRRSDKAIIEVWIPEEILHLVKRYRDPSGKRAFRFYKDYADKGTFNAAINKGLNEEPKKGKKKDLPVGLRIGVPGLEFYSARHSWATIALNDVGLDKYTIHSALNHVDPDMKVTDIYLKKDWSVINNANRKVLDYIFKKPEETNPPASE